MDGSIVVPDWSEYLDLRSIFNQDNEDWRVDSTETSNDESGNHSERDVSLGETDNSEQAPSTPIVFLSNPESPESPSDRGLYAPNNNCVELSSDLERQTDNKNGLASPTNERLGSRSTRESQTDQEFPSDSRNIPSSSVPEVVLNSRVTPESPSANGFTEISRNLESLQTGRATGSPPRDAVDAATSPSTPDFRERFAHLGFVERAELYLTLQSIGSRILPREIDYREDNSSGSPDSQVGLGLCHILNRTLDSCGGSVHGDSDSDSEIVDSFKLPLLSSSPTKLAMESVWSRFNISD